jgi:hypothetical protein
MKFGLSSWHATGDDHAGTSTPMDVGSFAQGARRQLLGLILRDTLYDNGIPLDWLTAEALQALAPGRDPGTHVRFHIRLWDPSLLPYCPAVQAEFKRRLLMVDPTASHWLMGFSWQFALPKGAPWPRLRGSIPPPEVSSPDSAQPASL